MILVNGSSFGRAGGRLRRYPGGTENASIWATVRGSMPNWPIASTWGAARRENGEHADMAQSLRRSSKLRNVGFGAPTPLQRSSARWLTRRKAAIRAERTRRSASAGSQGPPRSS